MKLVFVSILVILTGCSRDTAETQEATTQAEDATSSPVSQVTESPIKQPVFEYKGPFESIEWTDLVPPDDLEAMLNPPEYIYDIEEGSEEDVAVQQIKSTDTESEDRYQQALVSTKIIPEYNERKVRIPGFIVPIEFSDEQVVTTFFLVPFFGACIHYPPPPPNQIIFAEFEQGIRLEVLYDPFFVEGTLYTTLIENELATSAYSMEVATIKPYYDDDGEIAEPTRE